MKTNLPQLEYKGYKGILRLNPTDQRVWGKICTPENPDTPIDSYEFAGDNIAEAQKQFEIMVRQIISHKLYKTRNQEWRKITDYESIRCVFNILPDEFKYRVTGGEFDKSLLLGVKGGENEVPLYFVTKAWEVILKGPLFPYDFKIGPEEEPDCSEKDIQDFLIENNASRTRYSACTDNNKMKALWKELFDIDLDTLPIDFTQFNKHLPPNVTDREYDDYFHDVSDGVNEWILDRINSPDLEGIAYDYVSSLMEFTAQILLIREGELF